jgi:hypothetical protein
LTLDDEHVRLHGKGGSVRTVLLDDRGYVALVRLYLARAGYASGAMFRAAINGRGGPLSYLCSRPPPVAEILCRSVERDRSITSSTAASRNSGVYREFLCPTKTTFSKPQSYFGVTVRKYSGSSVFGDRIGLFLQEGGWLCDGRSHAHRVGRRRVARGLAQYRVRTR